MPPGPDGEWTAEQIQKLDPYTNIVLVSGFIRTSPENCQAVRSPTSSVSTKAVSSAGNPAIRNALSEKWQAELKLRNLHSRWRFGGERTKALLQTNRQLLKEVEQAGNTKSAAYERKQFSQYDLQ